MIRIFFVFCALLLAACSSQTDGKYLSEGYGAEIAPEVYTVKSGDTLFKIAWKYGLNAKTIMRNNGISNPNKIYAGQKLYLTATKAGSRGKTASAKAPASKPMVRKGDWSWPMRGRIVKRFNAGQVGANGIRIAGTANQTVNASEAGTVAYTGNQLKGYGNVIIIKHDNGLLSAYGFLSKTYVEEGQTIKKRQKVGTVGYGANNKLMLHFEVRKNGKPTNPLRYIGSHYHF